jgi:hypothetical protein
MGLFQHTILKKYLKDAEDKTSVAYQLYTAYFHHSDIQENIRNSKEEQYQEGFLRELFVEILGYTLNPEPNYNLITEKKNETNSKKADGAILVNGEVVGVIELKDGKTTDLKQVEAQAFGYKNYHRKASYVVISNFEKLRFYIDNAIDFIEFNLFSLTQDDFAILWLCLAYENIASNLPKQIKDESVSSEDQITKQLYKDYSAFKRVLFDDLTKLNPEYDRLTLFKKSQKLLDRLLFILFAEDSGLLPPNSVVEIVKQWETLKELDEYRPLYDRLKKYFGYMNTGHKGKKHDIFAYNGGLFKPDEVLDNIRISDEALCPHLKKISEYNFYSEVDVNILGHIFENSLTEIEEITNSLLSPTHEHVPVSKTSKCKKDGVFYTPRYITAYIVENTLGKLCADKKAELEIDESKYFADKKRQLSTKKKLDEKLKTYRQWLLSLTVCDPACGSGAFLNAALDFLIAEHKLIDEMTTELLGGSIIFPDIENSILENNLYGVDINEESVEIAKLALWLRTAKPNRKLNSLNENIKCGNSLIPDPKVAGDKAFDWHTEFPKVFEKGGFDVVIGNPPYVFARENFSLREKKFFSKNYITAKYQINTYMLFMENSFHLLKQDCMCGLIIPDSWLMIYSAEDLRKFMMEHCSIDKIASLKGKSFEEANVETVILIAKNSLFSENSSINILSSDEKSSSFLLVHNKRQSDFLKNKGFEFKVFSDEISSSLIEKLRSGSENLDDVCSVKAGLKAYEKGKGIPKQSEEDVKARPYDFNFQYNSDTYRYLEGADVLRYGISWSGSWLWYGSHLAAPRTFELFSNEKIIVREISGKYPKCIIAAYSDEIYLYNLSNVTINKREGYDLSLKYVTAILNSSLMSYYFTKNTAKAERKLFPKIILNDLRLFPIKDISTTDQQPFIDLADQMLTLNAELQSKRQRFHKRLSDNFETIKINTALERFDEMEFKQFVAELKKQKFNLSLTQQDEWEEYFKKYKNECNILFAQIAATGKTIDQMVYELYGLTEEEVRIIENN